MNHLVIIGYVWPEPRSSAAGYHMLSIIELFKKNQWQVTFASPALLSEHRADLSSVGVDEVSIELNSSRFDDWIKNVQPTAVLFDRFMMEEQFGWRVEKNCPNALRILDTEDFHSLRDARHKLLKKQLNEGQLDLKALTDINQVFPYLAQSDIAKREIASIYRSDLTMLVSNVEHSILTQHFSVPESILVLCPFMQPQPLTKIPDFEERQHFISIGNFRHAPNWDAVLWLKQQLWPKIKAQLPEAELHVYGAYPPPKATQLHSEKQGFLVKGWAEDAFEVLSHARVLLAPLRFGAGIKGKLLDAMRTGTPSVTTGIGQEGMSETHQTWPGFCEDNIDEYVANAVELFCNQAVWEARQKAGFELLQTNFDRGSIEANFMSCVEHLLKPEQRVKHRLNNFTGQMLLHHQHKSTQYMSQWIEAKNRNPEGR